MKITENEVEVAKRQTVIAAIVVVVVVAVILLPSSFFPLRTVIQSSAPAVLLSARRYGA